MQGRKEGSEEKTLPETAINPTKIGGRLPRKKKGTRQTRETEGLPQVGSFLQAVQPDGGGFATQNAGMRLEPSPSKIFSRGRIISSSRRRLVVYLFSERLRRSQGPAFFEVNFDVVERFGRNCRSGNERIY